MESPILHSLFEIAVDLTSTLAADDRYRHLLQAVRRVVPCDAAALLRLEGGALVPLAVDGLLPEVVGRRFAPAEHPRLARILSETGPVRLSGSPLPDPFDGLLRDHPDPLSKVHGCMGCALRVEGELVGALTMDAHDPAAFEGVDDRAVAAFAALAAAAIRTARLIEALALSARRQGLVARQLLEETQARRGGELIGQSQAMQRLRTEVALLADSDLTALITGETGVGKEVVARSIHAQSRRSKAHLIYVNCAALPESIAESELFGHTRGAFTGAVDHRAGKFEAADGGTLFLDEVGELPLSVQPKLLRALQSGEVQRVGSDRLLHVDVRVLAATNRDLALEVSSGRFRPDLYHRLSVYPLHVPPLRDRLDDVPILTGFFLDAARGRLGLTNVRATAAAQAALVSCDWPGNVRELEHILLRATLRASHGRQRATVVVDVEHLGLGPAVVRPGTPMTPSGAEPGFLDLPMADALEAVRRLIIQRNLAAADGNWAEAARRLGLDRGNLHRLATRLGLLGGDRGRQSSTSTATRSTT